MMSFRRSLSAQDNGSSSPISSSSPSSTAAASASASASVSQASILSSFTSSWMKGSKQQIGMGLERSVKTPKLWRKPVLHFFLCFFAGFSIGLTPLSHQDLSMVSHAGSKIISIKEIQVEDSVAPNAAPPPPLSPFDAANPPKLLLIVTPTYTRPFQALHLTRLAHTLKLVPAPLLWIVVEMRVQSLETAALLRKSGIMYRHLVCDKNLTDVKDRGIHQRNAALTHIQKHQLDGIVYFADDDNFYSLQLFHQLRNIKRFGTWPVAMLAHSKSKAVIEGPVCKEKKVIGWHTNEKSKRLRRFHVDMCGFAFNSTILWDPLRWGKRSVEPIRQLDSVKEGFQETTFIEQLVEDENDMEGMPSECDKIMVWHLHVESHSNRLHYPAGWTLDRHLEAAIHLR